MFFKIINGVTTIINIISLEIIVIIDVFFLLVIFSLFSFGENVMFQDLKLIMCALFVSIITYCINLIVYFINKYLFKAKRKFELKYFNLTMLVLWLPMIISSII